MRTVEVLFVIIILLSAFFITTYFAVLPSPSQAFGTNLRELSQSTLETLDAEGILSQTVFKDPADPAWADLQKALSASLPPNIVYNLNVYNLSTNQDGIATYNLEHSISDASFGVESGATSLLVASPNVTFTEDPQKIGESTGKDITLYILNCSDANGWWITGYTGQSLAADVHDLLSPYFTTTVLVNSTYELGLLLNGTPLTSQVAENVTDAVVVNTFGETVPIPEDYCEGGSHQDEGFNATYGTYAKYCYTLGVKTQQYNWTWVSIVGYPLYYVSNTGVFTDASDQNGYGIHGMIDVGAAGLNAFLHGLDGHGWVYDDDWLTSEIDVVEFTDNALDKCNYYGIYPSPNQTASRALPASIETDYHLNRSALVFELKGGYSAAATYRHTGGAVEGGALTAIGLTRIPDVRVSALALLVYYNPTIYKTMFEASGTSVLVTLQLGQQGGA
jgi:hypothetical protein